MPNKVRGHGTGVSHSGREECPRGKQKQTNSVVHAYSEYIIAEAEAIHSSARKIKTTYIGNHQPTYVSGPYWYILYGSRFAI